MAFLLTLTGKPAMGDEKWHVPPPMLMAEPAETPTQTPPAAASTSGGGQP